MKIAAPIANEKYSRLLMIEKVNLNSIIRFKNMIIFRTNINFFLMF